MSSARDGKIKEISARTRLDLMAEVKREQEKKRVRYELPHLFGFPPYKWVLEYWHSTNRMKFVVAGNQISKSSSQIRHAIDLMTDTEKWPKYFPKWHKENGVPPIAWYLYPNISKVNEEWDKWEREFLPRGAMKLDAQYGWKLEKDKNGMPMKLTFNTGGAIWFKTWYQDHQAGTLAALFIDEEPLVALWPELMMRTSRYDGLISVVFTATLNQPFFFDIIERRGQPDEKYPEADKWQVSMEYDCRYYADGTPSPWTPEEVAKQKAKCGTDDEINRRVHGRFVSNKGRKYPSFNRAVNIVQRKPIDLTWDFYAGVDIGSGGEDAHPASIAIVAVRPDYKYARAVRLWRGGTDETTNTTQILNQYLLMSKDLPMTKALYDHQSAEFKLRAREAGVPFEMADKSRDFGSDLINVLLKNRMLDIEESTYANMLATEFENLRSDVQKKNAVDDLIDALRYATSKIPFDLSGITGDVKLFEAVEEKIEITQEQQRQGVRDPRRDDENEKNEWGYEAEIDFYNSFLE